MIVTWTDDAGHTHTGDEHGREYKRHRAAHPESVDQGDAPAAAAKDVPALPVADPAPAESTTKRGSR